MFVVLGPENQVRYIQFHSLKHIKYIYSVNLD